MAPKQAIRAGYTPCCSSAIHRPTHRGCTITYNFFIFRNSFRSSHQFDHRDRANISPPLPPPLPVEITRSDPARRHILSASRLICGDVMYVFHFRQPPDRRRPVCGRPFSIGHWEWSYGPTKNMSPSRQLACRSVGSAAPMSLP